MAESSNKLVRALTSGAERLGEWLGADRKRRWWVLIVFVTALAVRLNWNLNVHPLDGFLYSDMAGYSGRADAILKDPWSSREYDAFFPFGTAWLIAAIKWVARTDFMVGRGVDEFRLIGTIYAFFGAGIVAACYAIADRVMGERVRWVAPVVGLFLIVYYPLISIGGYILSELPFSFCLTMSLLLLIRVVEEGKYRHALLLGFLLGCGALIRSQMVASIGLVGLFWLGSLLIRPNPYPKLTWKHIVCVGIPLAMLLGLAAVRFHIHTGRRGLVSENSTINLVFGRCHNKGIYSRPDGKGHGTVRFAPPPLIQLEVHSQEHPEHFFRSDSLWADYPEPVPGVDGFAIDDLGCRKRPCRLPGSEIQYKGYIGDGDIHRTIVKECMKRAGVKRQMHYTLTHWAMLWDYNLMWPDQANPRPRPKDKKQGWRAKQERWAKVHRWVLMVPALFGLGFVFVPRRRPKEALVALNFWALMIIAGVWLGGIRFRSPYDPVIVLLAAFVYGLAWEQARRLIRHLRGKPEPEDPAEGAPEDPPEDLPEDPPEARPRDSVDQAQA